MPFEIIRNDITNMCVDAIVNTANPRSVIGLGTDSMIHEKAGTELLAARKKIGNIARPSPRPSIWMQSMRSTPWALCGMADCLAKKNCCEAAIAPSNVFITIL